MTLKCPNTISYGNVNLIMKKSNFFSQSNGVLQSKLNYMIITWVAFEYIP